MWYILVVHTPGSLEECVRLPLVYPDGNECFDPLMQLDEESVGDYFDTDLRTVQISHEGYHSILNGFGTAVVSTNPLGVSLEAVVPEEPEVDFGLDTRTVQLGLKLRMDSAREYIRERYAPVFSHTWDATVPRFAFCDSTFNHDKSTKDDGGIRQ